MNYLQYVTIYVFVCRFDRRIKYGLNIFRFELGSLDSVGGLVRKDTVVRKFTGAGLTTLRT